MDLDITAGLLPVLFWLVALWIAYGIGLENGRADMRPDIYRAERYARAVEDLDRWCGATSEHAKVIAVHMMAVGEGRMQNAGTPAGSEPCTIQGLREQLRRIDNASR